MTLLVRAGSGNVRNGSRAETVLTGSTGQVEIDVPRDRAGPFEPQLVRERQRRLTGADEIVLSLYAKSLRREAVLPRPARGDSPRGRWQDPRGPGRLPGLPTARAAWSAAEHRSERPLFADFAYQPASGMIGRPVS